MDYAKLLRRALDILIAHKYLFILGVLAAFNGSGTYGSGGSSGGNSGTGSGDAVLTAPPDSLEKGFEAIVPFFDNLDWLFGLSVVLIIGLVIFAIVIGLVLWAIGAVAQGGLIAGVVNAEENEEDATTFGQAWAAGWAKGWRLIGISLLPLLPLLFFLGGSVLIIAFTVGFSALSAESIFAVLGTSFAVMLMCLFCLLTPLWILFDVMRIFAMRACMLDDTGVFASYARGWQVVSANLGPALILLLIRFGFAIALAIVLFLPTAVMAVCCLMWPLLLLINGSITAYFSAVWTLAWREWTGSGGSTDEEAVAVAAA